MLIRYCSHWLSTYAPQQNPQPIREGFFFPQSRQPAQLRWVPRLVRDFLFWLIFEFSLSLSFFFSGYAFFLENWRIWIPHQKLVDLFSVKFQKSRIWNLICVWEVLDFFSGIDIVPTKANKKKIVNDEIKREKEKKEGFWFLKKGILKKTSVLSNLWTGLDNPR